jgi:Ran GTPase-activating protein (RanGAP) involved in mRNA processing and transport
MISEKEMIDISFVLSINTPLRNLNLSQNVVNAKAAKILSESLRTNSHLKVLDLRENKLGDAGVAVLLEPFII